MISQCAGIFDNVLAHVFLSGDIISMCPKIFADTYIEDHWWQELWCTLSLQFEDCITCAQIEQRVHFYKRNQVCTKCTQSSHVKLMHAKQNYYMFCAHLCPEIFACFSVSVAEIVGRPDHGAGTNVYGLLQHPVLSWQQHIPGEKWVASVCQSYRIVSWLSWAHLSRMSISICNLQPHVLLLPLCAFAVCTVCKVCTEQSNLIEDFMKQSKDSPWKFYRFLSVEFHELNFMYTKWIPH